MSHDYLLSFSTLAAPFQKRPCGEFILLRQPACPSQAAALPISHLFWQLQGLHSIPPNALIHTHRHPHGPVFNQPSISAKQTCIWTHTHTHTLASSKLNHLLLLTYPSFHPSIHLSSHPSCSVCWCDNSWLINLWFPSSPVPKRTHAHTHWRMHAKSLLTIGTHLSWLHRIDSLICFILLRQGRGGDGEMEGGDKGHGERKTEEKGLIKSLSADAPR